MKQFEKFTVIVVEFIMAHIEAVLPGKRAHLQLLSSGCSRQAGWPIGGQCRK
jgi:hypothetical protein